jgi:arginyl-tRNA synthetase
MDIPILFGRFLVRERIITDVALADAVRVQTEINRSFDAVAQVNDFISLEDFKKAIEHQREYCVSFREALQKLEIADEETIDKIDETYSNRRVKLGELLVTRGILSEDELQNALEEFKEKGVVEFV